MPENNSKFNPSTGSGQKLKVQIKNKKEEKRSVQKTAKSKALTVDVYDIKGKVVGSVELPAEMFGATVNKNLMAQAVRAYLANQRKGSASTKTRGEVRGSTRKIYRQKGTGRARHGSIRAPIFVKGGIVFGPKPRDYSLQLPKKMKRKALFAALSAKVTEGNINVITGLEKIEPKTKVGAGILKNLSIDREKKTLLVVPSSKEVDTQSLQRAVRNIAGVAIMQAQNLNTYVVLNSDRLLFLKQSLDTLSKTGRGTVL